MLGLLDFGLIQRKPGVTNYVPQNAVYASLINPYKAMGGDGLTEADWMVPKSAEQAVPP